ncbi:Chromosomal replication initiator protein DnaA [termite gut metagenome]|uniref:Chromosomal replication initiator protein DnaA n=1 Tax=termite gut metagenome TaxID=433724 RepID=A0A5J4SXG0_9ZZZZ
MRIYISGKITGLPWQEVKDKFQAAQDLLEELGFEATNPLNNGLSFNDDWKKHIVCDIGNLLSCEAVYLLDNWMDSTGAGIEYDIALRMKMDIWFESAIVRNQNIVLRIQNAIHEVTGMTLREYTTKSRQRDAFFARMIFAYHCRKHNMKLTDIATHVHRDRSSMIHLFKKYDDETKYNPSFRVLAERVNDRLN